MRPDASAAAHVVLSVQDLTCSFGSIVAVSGLTFDVQAGELFGIVGPDGAGKTTTLRMLSGVLRPDAGDAVVLGESVARHAERVKPHIAYMAQRFGLYEDLTVAENIDFYADLYRVSRKDRADRLGRLYEFSSLGPFRDRLVGNLSGGMKQKASLCCALIHRPRLLLLDEPTFGVDPISRRDLWLILHEMSGEGMTIVLTTSYLDEAERCDRVALIDGGRLLSLGSPTELQQAFPRVLLEVPRAGRREQRQRLAQVIGVRTVLAFGESAHVTVDTDAAVEDVIARMAAAGFAAEGVHAIEPSLEDVFLDKVGAGHAH
jgi:ABC-2 type transport system ATP-binding protein